MNKTQIRIEPAPAELNKYRHAALHDDTAKSFKAVIERLQGAGVEVLEACGPRYVVPNSYGPSAHTMKAPAWRFDGECIYAAIMVLEKRPHGATIPAWFECKATETPEGFRCFKRSEEEGTMIIREK